MQIVIGSCNMKLPDFLIVGASKSGTTSLYYYLKQHPQIFMPEHKEPWFFSCVEVDKPNKYIIQRTDTVKDFITYTNLFTKAKDRQVLGEASTGYLYLYEQTIKNIKKYHPHWEELKIIIIIRDPTERAFSHYLDDKRCGLINLSFEEVIKKWKNKELSEMYPYIEYGFYYNQTKAYQENFKQVKIYLFEDLRNNPKELLCDLFKFLGVDSGFVPDISIKYNISEIPESRLLVNFIYRPNPIKKIINLFIKKEVRLRIKNRVLKKLSYRPELEDYLRAVLKEIYKEDILKLQDLLQRDLALWQK